MAAVSRHAFDVTSAPSAPSADQGEMHEQSDGLGRRAGGGGFIGCSGLRANRRETLHPQLRRRRRRRYLAVVARRQRRQVDGLRRHLLSHQARARLVPAGHRHPGRRPGHTPGHQSLLVKLPKTGAVVLSGDAVHFKSNWDNRGVPVNNTSKEQTLASMERIADTLTKEKAQLWINHDKAQRDGLKMSPEFYD